MSDDTEPPPVERRRRTRDSEATSASKKSLYYGGGAVLLALATAIPSFFQSIAARSDADHARDEGSKVGVIARRADLELDSSYQDLRQKVEQLAIMAAANATEIRLLREFCPTRKGRALPPEIPRPPVSEILKPLPPTPAASAALRKED